MKAAAGAFQGMRRAADEAKGIRETYSLIKELSSINGPDIGRGLLDRAMFNFEALPPLGKEYWWLLFFGRDLRQMMLLIFRKSGRSMVFTGEEVVFKKIDRNAFQVVTAGWIYDGEEMLDLGVSNKMVVISPKENAIFSEISDRKMIFEGSFPEYELRIDGLVHVKMTRGDFPENKCAHGVFFPPFGTGWVDVFSNAEGNVLGQRFSGTAHLQKVVGVMPYGSFHWARVVFQDGSMFSFFCLKAGRDSKRYFRVSVSFYDHEKKRHIRFKKPTLTISRERKEAPRWVVEGWDKDHRLRAVLESYAEKRYTMNGRGSQTYIEYAVTPNEFIVRTDDRIITLENLGRGVGTFEDAYGSLAS